MLAALPAEQLGDAQLGDVLNDKEISAMQSDLSAVRVRASQEVVGTYVQVYGA